MDDTWTTVSSFPDAYFNLSLVFLLRYCHTPPSPPSNLDHLDDQVSEGENKADLSDFAGSVSEVFSWLLGGSREEARDSVVSWEVNYDCQDVIHKDVGGAVSVVNLVKISLGLIITFIFSIIVIRLVWRKCAFWLKSKKSTAEKRVDDVKSEKKEDTIVTQDQTDVNNVGAVNTDHVTPLPKPEPAVKTGVPVVITLGNSGSKLLPTVNSPNIVVKPDSSKLLRHTVDHVLTQLDWMLGLTSGDRDDPSTSSTSPMSAAAASLLTPRLQRKGGSIRRPRWRTVTSLPFEAGDISPDDKMAVHMWQRVEDMEKKMDWSRLDLGDLDINAVHDPRLSAILQFYQQTCPVAPQQWSAACLIVNYVLTLLELELTGISRSPLTVVELRSFGSTASQTCISRANRFNVMLVLQLAACSEMIVYDSAACDVIPPGKLALGVKDNSAGSMLLTQKDRVGDNFGAFLSVRETMKATQRLLSNALDRLKLTCKSFLDRLTFTLHLSPYDDLQLSIDTRMLNNLGLGLSEITIRFTPALQVSSEQSSPLSPLFAVPPWNVSTSDNSSDGSRSRLQSRVMRSTVVAGDLLWQLNCSEATKSFMQASHRRLQLQRVSGCQVLCQQILRAAFSRSGKDTLLTTGELPPHILDTVIHFLLLESPARAWDLTCLPDRFSDCVHFLRAAVQSTWMPGFMVHNPHLLKHTPALKLLPLLAGRRQENLLGGVAGDTADDILSFLDTRLQETGLRRCVKEDYSTEMWEYEFFIFG